MAEIPFRAEWLSAFENIDGYSLMCLLEKESRLLKVKYRGCNVLHLAMRHNWFGLVEKILRKFDNHSQSTKGKNGPPIDVAILKDLLTAKEGDGEQTSDTDTTAFFASGLDVLAMAVIQGHGAIKTLLGISVSKIDCLFDENHHYKNVFRRMTYGPDPVGTPSIFDLSTNENEREREILRGIMGECFFKNQRLECRIEKRWLHRWVLTSQFLPLEEFLFLACHLDNWFRGKSEDANARNLVFKRCAERKRSDTAFIKYLLTIHDTRGTALNHAVVNERPESLGNVPTKSLGNVNNESFVLSFELSYELIPDGNEFRDYVNVRDNLGRTPLLTAIALGREEECRLLLDDPRTDVNATYNPFARPTGTLMDHAHPNVSKWMIKVGTVSKENGYWATEDVTYSALHLLICNPDLTDDKRKTIMELLLLREDLDLNSLCYHDTELSKTWYGDLNWMTPLQLAAYVGDVTSLQLLAKDDRAYDPARLYNLNPKPYDEYDEGYSALHVAAMSGHSQAIRIIFSSGKFDMVVQHPEGENTALHCATRFAFPFHFPHTLTDFFRIPLKRQGNSYEPKESLSREEQDVMIRKGESQRQGCINLLLQVSIDIWPTNKENQIADPGPEASPEYGTWCFEKLSKETQEVQSSLKAAANAISVTAALVATASYVGPLQPPLGYAADGDGLRVSNLLVRIFIVCNTLAFYFALAAIMLSLTPALPMPQDSTHADLKVLRTTVNRAVALLILSTVTVLLAFASASITVIPNEGSWNHGGLTASTFIVGGMICLGALWSIFDVYLVLYLKPIFKGKHFWSGYLKGYEFSWVWVEKTIKLMKH